MEYELEQVHGRVTLEVDSRAKDAFSRASRAESAAQVYQEQLSETSVHRCEAGQETNRGLVPYNYILFIYLIILLQQIIN